MEVAEEERKYQEECAKLSHLQAEAIDEISCLAEQLQGLEDVQAAAAQELDRALRQRVELQEQLQLLQALHSPTDPEDPSHVDMERLSGDVAERLKASFSYRILERVGKRICPSALVEEGYAITTQQDLLKLQQHFQELRLIRRILLRSVEPPAPPGGRPPWTRVASVSFFVSGSLFTSDFVRSDVAVPTVGTQDSAPCVPQELLRDECVLSSLRFKVVPRADATRDEDELRMRRLGLEKILLQWACVTEQRINEKVAEAAAPSEEDKSARSGPLIRCMLRPLTDPEDLAQWSYEALLLVSPDAPPDMKSKLSDFSKSFARNLVQNIQRLIGRVRAGVTSDETFAQRAAGIIGSSTERAENIASNAVGVLDRISALCDMLLQVLSMNSWDQAQHAADSFRLHFHRLFALLQCLAVCRTYVEASAMFVSTPLSTKSLSIRWLRSFLDMMLPLSEGVMSFTKGTHGKEGDEVLQQSVSKGKAFAGAAYEEFGDKMFAQCSKFLGPFLRYFQFPNATHSWGAAERMSVLSLLLCRMPYDVLMGLHKMTKYGAPIVLYRTIVDEKTKQMKRVRAKVTTKGNFVSTKSKITLGLTLFDELHFNLKRPRPMSEQNDWENESLIEQRINVAALELECRWNDELKKLRAVSEEKSKEWASPRASPQATPKKEQAESPTTPHEGGAQVPSIEEATKNVVDAFKKWTEDPIAQTLEIGAFRAMIPVSVASSDRDAGAYSLPPVFLNFRWASDPVTPRQQ